MITEEKAALELAFWIGKRNKDQSGRFKRALKLWDVPGSELGDVLDVGCGPRGGVLSYIKATKKVGLDPLLDRYDEAKILKHYPDIEYIVGCIEDTVLADRFDWIFSMSSLGNGESDFSCFEKFTELLKPGGRFCLHVRLRPPDRLDVQHARVLLLSQYEEEVEANGLQEEWREVFPRDPLTKKPHATLMTRLRKPIGDAKHRSL